MIGIGTRYSDFTTASRTAFADPGVRFVNINVAGDRRRQARRRRAWSADARRGAGRADRGAGRLVTPTRPTASAPRELAARVGRDRRARLPRWATRPLPAQSEVIGAVNEVSGPRDVVVCAAGSMPGDLHKLWRTRDPKGYHVEYGYSCMGYEIAGGLGVEAGRPGPRRARHGRRRLLPDDGAGAGHRGPGGHQDHRRAGAEPRLRLDRRAVRDRSARSGSAPATATATRSPAGWTATSCRSTWPRTRRASACQVLRAAHDRGVPQRARAGARQAGGPVARARRDRPAGAGAGQRVLVGRPGGRGRRPGLHPARRARPTRPHKADQRPYLRSERGDADEDHRALDRRSRRPPATATRRGPVCNPATGAAAGRGRCWPSRPTSTPPSPRPRRPSTTWSQASLSRRTQGPVRVPRAASNARVDELAEIISDEHGKVALRRPGEVQRGLEVVEFACGIPTLLKGDYSDQVSTGVDVLLASASRSASCAGITPFNFPVMVPMWMYPVAIACGNTFVLKPSERDPSASDCRGRGCGPRRGCRTASSTSCTATRSRSTRCSTTPTSPRSRSSAPPRSPGTSTSAAPRRGKRVQALGGAKNHAIVLPDADLDFASDHLVAAAFGSAGERCMAISAAVAVGPRRRRADRRSLSEKATRGAGRRRPRPGQRDGPGGHRRGPGPDRRADRRRRAAGRPARGRRPRPRRCPGPRTASSSGRP